MPHTISLPSAKFIVEDSYPEFWANMSGGRWEPMTLNVFRDHIDAQTTFVDIGSWIGPTTLFAANIARRVICLEPDPVAAAQLRRNVQLNPALEGKIEILETAISSQPGTVRLGARTGKGDSMSSLLFQKSADHWDVPAITPTELAAKLQSETKLFFKVDIEGGEYEVLRLFEPLAKLPNAKFLIAFHPSFLPAKSLWSFSTAMKTARALQPFAGYSLKLVKKTSVRELPVFSFLNRVGMGIFPIHHSVLLSKAPQG